MTLLFILKILLKVNDNLFKAPKAVIPLQLLDDTSVTEDTSTTCSESENEDLNTAATPEPVPSGSHQHTNSIVATEQNRVPEDRSVDRLSSGSEATLPYCDNSDTNSNMSSRECSRDSSPYPSCSDLNLRFSSQIDRSSDVSQESSPCPSPADFSVRRSARLDRYSDTSRDTSPLIFDSDFGLRRSSRNRARLKNIPALRATRNLSKFLLDENSTSNSSVPGENSLTGLGTSLFNDNLASHTSSKSSEIMEDSNDCDIHVDKLFANSKATDSAKISASFHKVLENANENRASDIGIISSQIEKKSERTYVESMSADENVDFEKNVCCKESVCVNVNNNVECQAALTGTYSAFSLADEGVKRTKSEASVDTHSSDNKDILDKYSTDVCNAVGDDIEMETDPDISEDGSVSRENVAKCKSQDKLQHPECALTTKMIVSGVSDSVDIIESQNEMSSESVHNDVSESPCNVSRDDLREMDNIVTSEMVIDQSELSEAKKHHERIEKTKFESDTYVPNTENTISESEYLEKKAEPNNISVNTHSESENEIKPVIKVEPIFEMTDGVFNDLSVDFKLKREQREPKDFDETSKDFAADLVYVNTGKEECKFDIKNEKQDTAIDGVKSEIKEEMGMSSEVKTERKPKIEKQAEHEEEAEHRVSNIVANMFMQFSFFHIVWKQGASIIMKHSCIT